MSDILTADFTPDPYWWDAAPLADAEVDTLPSEVDVVVVGSGFTGLSAALELARGGRDVAVLEASRLGQGASTRNNGALVPYLYLKLDTLMKHFGESRGVAIAMTAVQSLEYFLDFLEAEGIDCDLKAHERYFLALAPSHLDGLNKLIDLYPQHGIDIGWESLPSAKLVDETGLDGYAGAVVARRALAIHPGICHAALLERVRQAGATLIEGTEVLGVNRRDNSVFRVETNRGPIDAAEVVVATNGYTGPAFPLGSPTSDLAQGVQGSLGDPPPGSAGRNLPDPTVFRQHSAQPYRDTTHPRWTKIHRRRTRGYDGVRCARPCHEVAPRHG